MLVPITSGDRGDRRRSSSMIRQASMSSTLNGEEPSSDTDPLLKADGTVRVGSLLTCLLICSL